MTVTAKNITFGTVMPAEEANRIRYALELADLIERLVKTQKKGHPIKMEAFGAVIMILGPVK